MTEENKAPKAPKAPKPTTKIIEVQASVYRKFTSTVLVQVPYSMSKADMAALVEARSNYAADPSAFKQDPTYFKQAPGSASVVEGNDKVPTLMAWMTPKGIHVEPFTAPAQEETAGVDAAAQNPADTSVTGVGEEGQ